MKHQSEYKVREHICQIGRLIFEKGFVAANDGNISVRISENEILTTPTQVSKGFLKPDMIVKVDLDGNVLAGNRKPSSELKMHLRVYKERSDVHAVVHAHPPYSTAFAIAGLPLNQALMPESVVLLGTIPVAEYGTPSTEEIPNAVAKYVHNHSGLLLENHGALTWGSDLLAAYYLMESLEFTAKINFIVKQLGGERELSEQRVSELLKIRAAMGITGETPRGIPCEPDVDVCDLDSAVPTPTTTISNEDMKTIVDRVTQAVLSRL